MKPSAPPHPTRPAVPKVMGGIPSANELLYVMDQEITAIRNGSHRDFLAQVLWLEDKKHNQLQYAEMMKARRTQMVDDCWEAEQNQAEEDFETEKKELKNELIRDALRRKKIIGLRLAGKAVKENGMVTRKKAQLKGSRKRSKRESQFGIRHTLTNQEIQEDLRMMNSEFEPWPAPSSAVRVDADCVWCYGVCARLNEVVGVELCETGKTFDGQVVEVSPFRLHVLRSDGLEVRLWVKDIASRAVKISAPHNPLSD